MLCDLCGKEEARFESEIEGTRMNTCTNCAKFGKVVGKIVKERKYHAKEETIRPTQSRDEIIQLIVKNYPALVKQAREKTGVKQEDFAKKINEKVSVIHNVESGRHEPSIPLARKLEKTLGIKLVEAYEKKQVDIPKSSSEADLTIGSIVNIKHRKKKD